MRIAFKEWAVVVDALGRGDQIIILRKGGVTEGRTGFQIQHDRFLLFPTLFHQQRESVISSAQRRYDASLPSLLPHSIHIAFVATLADWKHIDSFDAVMRLRGQHVWRDEVIRDRFDRGVSKGIFAMALRVSRLTEHIVLPMRSEYGGCKSWAELDSVVPTGAAQQVLTDSEFESKLQHFRAALEPAVVP